MPPVLNPEPGSTTANSFVDLAFYKAFIDERTPRPLWASDAVSGTMDDELIRDLITATRIVSSGIPWVGVATFPGQALAHPMTGLKDLSGNDVDSSVVASGVKFCTCETAIQLHDATQTVVTPDYIREGIKSVKGGDVELHFQSIGQRDGVAVQMLSAVEENRYLSLVPSLAMLYLNPKWYKSPESKPPSNKPQLIFKVV